MWCICRNYKIWKAENANVAATEKANINIDENYPKKNQSKQGCQQLKISCCRRAHWWYHMCALRSISCWRHKTPIWRNASLMYYGFPSDKKVFPLVISEPIKKHRSLCCSLALTCELFQSFLMLAFSLTYCKSIFCVKKAFCVGSG